MKIPYANNKPIMDQIFDEVRSKKHTVMSILESYTHLLKAIEYLININIVHFDLKSDNVLYDSDMNHANIIDFGLSIPIDQITDENLKEYFYIYSAEYYVWPLEVHIINYLLHEFEEGEEADDIASRISEEYVASNKGLQIFSDKFTQLFEAQCRDYVMEVLDGFEIGKRDKVIKDLIVNYATWDNYSVSILYLRIIDLIFPNGFPENDFYIDLTRLLLINIHPDPRKRLSVVDTRQRFYELFYLNENIDTYIKMIEDINVNIHKIKKDFNSENNTLNSKIEKTRK